MAVTGMKRPGAANRAEKGGDILASSISHPPEFAYPLFSKLEGIKQTGPGRWQAQCPAHEDRDPSLSIRETSDGRVLLFCHAGCDTKAVLAALGLGWEALFPAGSRTRVRVPREREALRDLELVRKIDEACRNAGVRLLHLCRAAENILAREGPEAWENEGLAFWIENIPRLRELRDVLFSGAVNERLNALQEVQKCGL